MNGFAKKLAGLTGLDVYGTVLPADAWSLRPNTRTQSSADVQ